MTNALHLGKRIERVDSNIGGPGSGGRFIVPLEIATQTLGILGQRGSGKSNTQVVLAEKFYDAGIPWVAIDPKGDWWGIRSNEDGDGEGLPIPILGGLHGDVSIGSTEGAQWADVIADANLTCVVDVSDFSKGERAKFLVAFFDRLYRRHRQDPQARHVFLEEAHEYIPQMVGREDGQLKEAASRIVLQGRSFGLGASACSQRSARLHKDVLMQIGTLIAHRTTGPLDRKAIEGWIVEHEQRADLIESLPSLGNGEAWVWSPEFMGEISRVQFLRRRTFDSGATPIVGAQARQITTLAQVDLAAIKEQMAESLERAKADDPKELRKQLAAAKARVVELEMWVPPPAPAPIIIQGVPPRLLELRESMLDSMRESVRLAGEISAEIDRAVEGMEEAVAEANRDFPPSNEEAKPAAPQASAPRPPRQAPPRQQEVAPGIVPAIEEITEARQKILDALAWYAAVGVDAPSRGRLAFVADTTPASSHYEKNLAALLRAGLIHYPHGGCVGLTREGAALAKPSAAISTTRELIDVLAARLGEAKGRILRAVAELHPGSFSRVELAEATGTTATSSHYEKNLAALRDLGYIEFPAKGRVCAAPALFLKER
jgi:hypothetical protein